MKRFILRVLTMVFGLFLFALGVVVQIKASVGYAPWDVFQVGLAKTLGISIGTASISVGLVIVVIVIFLGEKIGLATVTNMILVGLFIDAIMAINIIPVPENFITGLFMLTGGLVVISFASYFYISSAFGAGPRDSLMVALTRKTKIPVGICRSTIELLATFCGWLLGGMVGIGTIIAVIGIGFCIQLTFKLLRFNVTSVKHESLLDTYRSLARRTRIDAD